MEKVVQYLTDDERTTLLNQNSTMYLIGEKNIFENGDYTKRNNYLIFSDTQPIEMQLKEQVDNQQAIKDGMADMYIAIASIPGVVL